MELLLSLAGAALGLCALIVPFLAHAGAAAAHERAEAALEEARGREERVAALHTALQRLGAQVRSAGGR
jgi:5-enolpyruvylshikimate-3-phosphate synthase